MNKKQIILDTNFLILPGQFKVDIFDEIEKVLGFHYELIVPEVVVEELKKLAKTNKKDAVHSKVALKLIEKNKIKIIKSKETYADKEIIRLVSSDNFIVATQDYALKRELRKKNVPLIFLRGKQHLILHGLDNF